jgi:hypothetical protein
MKGINPILKMKKYLKEKEEKEFNSNIIIINKNKIVIAPI